MSDYFYDNKILYSDLEFWLKSLSSSDVYFYNIPSVYYSFHSSNTVTEMNTHTLIYNYKFITSTIDFYKTNNVKLNYFELSIIYYVYK